MPETQEDKYFSKKYDYSVTLDKMREEFLTKYRQDTPSQGCNLGEYEIITVLGSGAFGRVKLCRDRKTRQVCAVKYLLKEHIIRVKQVKNVCNEKRLLKSMDFPFLVGFTFSCKDNDFLYLAMPFINGGELFTFHRRSRKFNEMQAKFYAAQVFLALEYMHALQLIHRDLKPENIIMDRFGYIKLADFGFTKRVEKRTLTLCGTPEYLAPEIIRSKPYGNSVDWWAFGVLIYEFVSGFSPFSKYAHDVMLMYSKICEGDYRIPLAFSPQLKNLVTNLLQTDLSRRFGNLISGDNDIKSHHWFDGIDWFDILNRRVEPPYIPHLKGPEDYSLFRSELDKREVRSPYNRFAEEFASF